MRIGAAFAKTIAPPTPCPTRITISQSAPLGPWSHVNDNRIEKTEKTAKPSVYIFTRPYMSPMRPKLTSRTAVQTMKPISIQSK